MAAILASHLRGYNPVDRNGELLNFVHDLRQREFLYHRDLKDREPRVL